MIGDRELSPEERTRFARAIVKLILVLYKEQEPEKAKKIMQ
jgi:hypothetical protein